MPSSAIDKSYYTSLDTLGMQKFTTKDFADAFSLSNPEEWKKLVNRYGAGGAGNGQRWTINTFMARVLSRMVSAGYVETMEWEGAPAGYGNEFIRAWRRTAKPLDLIAITRDQASHQNISSHSLEPERLLTAEAAIEVETEPLDITDARTSIWMTVKQRRGQKKFRDDLLRAYGERCAVTGCVIPDVLEAAHIFPDRGLATSKPHNGLLLRADIHTLFDCGLIRIDPVTRCLRLSPILRQSEYWCFNDKPLNEPSDKKMRPSADALSKRWEYDLSNSTAS